jgi:hypothetical protein
MGDSVILQSYGETLNRQRDLKTGAPRPCPAAVRAR